MLLLFFCCFPDLAWRIRLTIGWNMICNGFGKLRELLSTRPVFESFRKFIWEPRGWCGYKFCFSFNLVHWRMASWILMSYMAARICNFYIWKLPNSNVLEQVLSNGCSKKSNAWFIFIFCRKQKKKNARERD